MARLARVVAPGMPHHVIQRGNRHQQILFCDEDRAQGSHRPRLCSRASRSAARNSSILAGSYGYLTVGVPVTLRDDPLVDQQVICRCAEQLVTRISQMHVDLTVRDPARAS